VHVVGCLLGTYRPSKWDDKWKCGSSRRHILGENESLSQHAAQASLKAMEMAGVAADEIDMIILASSSPDDLFGSGCSV
jgi:3-oxoacyl-[acyl-carrier-protein] synthase-3